MYNQVQHWIHVILAPSFLTLGEYHAMLIHQEQSTSGFEVLASTVQFLMYHLNPKRFQV